MIELLIVDDERAIRELIIAVLEPENLYAFDQAVDGLQALEKIRLKRYDLVVVDRVMPGLTGVEMVRRLRQEAAIADTKVLICSASNIQKDIDEAMVSGADDYVVKPLDFSELIDVVARVVAAPRKKP